MKTLIVYYSRTGTSRKVAESLKAELETDIREIKCSSYKLGAIGYAIAGKDATFKKTTKIEPVDVNITDYDLVIIGSPTWSWNVAPPVRTFCRENKGKFNRIAFFCTMGGSGHEKVFRSMADECGTEPIATLYLLTREVVKDEYRDKINKFVNKIIK